MHEILRANDVEHINKRLLHFVRFREINTRYERIPLAYERTFEWVFLPPSSTAKWADLMEWIESDNSLYWITGKAGAGKSTLMKFIYDDERTHESLRTWAAGDPLVVASFFFWNSGSEIQMSQEGLVRTLLYQALSQMPHLIPLVFPHRLEVGIMFGEQVFEAEPWTWEELLKAFRTLIQKATATTKFVFFIDGMDEYKGKPTDLIYFLRSLLVSGVKICASSRPWIVFEDAFGSRANLRLEDLTFDDIKIYVSSELAANAGFNVLQELDSQYASQLIENITVKASGVFLWVYLVTQSLLDGLSEGERLSDLQQRLDSLPVDLENLFWKILHGLTPFHFERASQLFQILRASIRPLDLLSLSFADEEDPEYALKMACASLSPQQANSRAEIMRRRINACCKGLLGVDPGGTRPLFSAPVEYLHRTVKDFLEREDTWATLCRATDEKFNPNLRLCNSQIMRLKAQNPNQIESDFYPNAQKDSFWGHITFGIEYAVRGDPDCSGYQILLLDEIDRVAIKLTATRLSSDITTIDFANPGALKHWTRVFCYSQSFLEFAVQSQLVNYVRATLSGIQKSKSSDCVSQLLYLAVVHFSFFPDMKDRPAICHSRPNKDLIRLLLQLGANPNSRLEQSTTWEKLLADPYKYGTAIISDFLRHGADPHARLITASPIFKDKELQYLLQQKERKTTRWYRFGSKLRMRL